MDKNRANNTLNSRVTHQFTSNPQIFSWDTYDYTCSANPTDYLLGYTVYQGFITPQNITKAKSHRTSILHDMFGSVFGYSLIESDFATPR
jgi:hypothetical protein